MKAYYIFKAATILLATTLLINSCSNSQERYYLTSNKGSTYRIDKKTGKVWRVVGDKLILIDESTADIINQNDEKTKEHSAIDIAKDSDTFWYLLENNLCGRCYQYIDISNNRVEYHNNNVCIRQYLTLQKGVVDVKGWYAEEKPNNNFLVEYKYTIDGISKVYPLEVNVDIARAREIDSIELMMLYYKSIGDFVHKLYDIVCFAGSLKDFMQSLNSEDFRKEMWDLIFSSELDMTYEEFNNKLGFGWNIAIR